MSLLLVTAGKRMGLVVRKKMAIGADMRRRVARLIIAASVAGMVSVARVNGINGNIQEVDSGGLGIKELKEVAMLTEAFGGRADEEATPEPLSAIIFRQTARAAALDLFGTGHVTKPRAQGLAWVIVSEAHRQRVPVPLVIGVMRVENSTFKSRARSIVGATGLMQIMPKVWLPALGKRHGWNLENDTTNVRMGIAILGIYLKNAKGNWRTALLRYNGCVRGTVTRDCHTYPDKVRRAVERDARWLCQGKSFENCMDLSAFTTPAGRVGQHRIQSPHGGVGYSRGEE